MKCLIILLLVTPLTLKAESYMTIDANIGMELATNDDHWDGEVPFEFRVSYVKSINKMTYFTSGYSHMSNVLTGPPFNNDRESVLDRIFVGVGVKFNL